MFGKRYILTTIALLVLGCTQPETLSEKEKTEIIREARETLANYYNDIRIEGLKAEFKYLDNSPEFFWVPPGYASALSYDSIASILNKNAPALTSVDNSFDTVRIQPLRKDLVSYTGRLRSVVTDTSGNVSSVLLVETGILIKRKDGWKLLSGQTNVIKQ